MMEKDEGGASHGDKDLGDWTRPVRQYLQWRGFATSTKAFEPLHLHTLRSTLLCLLSCKVSLLSHGRHTAHDS